MKKSRLALRAGGKGKSRLGRWVNLLLLVALVIGGCVAPAAPDAATVADTVVVEQRISPVASTPTPTATTEAATATPTPTWTPGSPPTPRKIIVASGGSSSSVTVRVVTSTPTAIPQPTPTADATTLAIAAGAAPLIFTGLSIDQKCGRGDVVAVDGHELLATPRLLVDNSNFLELLPEGAQVDILDCLLWNDEEELSWLAVRTAKGKLGWMLLQPDKFYVTLLPVALAPPRSLTGVPAGTTVAYTPPSNCEDGPVSNEALATSIGIDLIPVVGDMKGLGEAATGCDLVTGESLGDWRWFGLLGLIGMSELALARHGDDALRAGRAANSLDGVMDYGDEAAAFTARNADTAADIARSANKLANAADTTSDAARTAEKSAGLSEEALQVLAKLEQPCSFAGDTPVLTAAGLLPIRVIRPGMLVWAFDEALGKASYYPVTAAFAHIDPLLLDVTIRGETIRTTPEHPFFVDGVWLSAGQIEINDSVLSASGVSGAVTKIIQVRQPQMMYNITVAQAHTYFVGDAGWLVHNACRRTLRTQLEPTVPKEWADHNVAWQAHHLIPVKHQNHTFVQKAGNSWDFDGAKNGIALPVSDGQILELCLKQKIQSTCSPVHRGSHPIYSGEVGSQLDDLLERAGREGWLDDNTAVARELDKLTDRLRTAIESRPPGQRID